MNQPQRILTMLMLGLLACISIMSAPQVVHGGDAVDTGTLPPPPASRTVTIDGRTYTITLSALRIIPGNISENHDEPRVEMTATIGIQDGALLPAGLKLSRVRLERLFGSSRVFFVPLGEGTDRSGNSFEEVERTYTVDLTRRTKGVRKLKATVRVELDGRVFPVSFGTIPVTTLPLP